MGMTDPSHGAMRRGRLFRPAWLLGTALFGLPVVPAGADEVRLANGARFEGRVIEESAERVRIETSGGALTIPRRNVASVLRRKPVAEAPPAPAMKPGSAAAGKPAARPVDQEAEAASDKGGGKRPDGPAGAPDLTPAQRALAAAIRKKPDPTPALKRQIQAELETVGSEDGPSREAYAATLAAKGRAATPALLQLIPRLESVDHLLPAVMAVTSNPTPEVVPLLRGMTKSDEPQRRLVAAYGLGQIGDAADLPILRPLLHDDESNVRVSAREALQTIASHHPQVAVVQEILPLLDESNPDLRREAVESLAALGSAEAFKTMQDLVERAEPELRGQALGSIATMRNSEVVPFLERMLHTGEVDWQVGVVQALGNYWEQEPVLPVLVDALLHEEPKVREAAGAQLGRLTGQDFGTDRDRWDDWLKEQKRLAEDKEREKETSGESEAPDIEPRG